MGVWDYHSKEFQAGLFVVAHELGRSVLGVNEINANGCARELYNSICGEIKC